MQINFNRICKLAGINSEDNVKQSLSEGRNLEEAEQTPTTDDTGDGPTDTVDEDALVEVDINELMSEIRRAKKLMKINEKKSEKSTKASKKQALQEAHLKRIIQKEIGNILSEIDKMDMQQHSWVYGDNQPKRSKKGHSALNQLIPSIGFDKK